MGWIWAIVRKCHAAQINSPPLTALVQRVVSEKWIRDNLSWLKRRWLWAGSHASGKTCCCLNGEVMEDTRLLVYEHFWHFFFWRRCWILGWKNFTSGFFFFPCKTNSSSIVKLKILKIAVFLRWEILYRRTSSVPVFKGVGGIDEELLVKLSSLITWQFAVSNLQIQGKKNKKQKT